MPVSRCLTPALGFAAMMLASTGSNATEPPSGDPVLTVSGRISEFNVDNHFVFDMAMLEAMPQHSFVTNTPWHPEAHEFSGPLLREVLARVGAEGENIQAIALNDYKVDIPVEDARRFNMIVARLMDGAPMSVRNKGPLFILYPFDNESETQSQIYYNRAIWQLKALNIE
ncbi:oxidoreductase [Marinobacterium nitratireducens]|uniref:Oxidoreductase n=1 Tax=Marinobacterium nitratireducens TaxID=518897 RepID=A0A917Z8N7_9GAMM|nr:molybdopterin-dependent oxidoreductase [Marinobacterium nitratireducens]GGO78094.1 oxidoreductase [Marinobacterium nitratireducens]